MNYYSTLLIGEFNEVLVVVAAVHDYGMTWQDRS